MLWIRRGEHWVVGLVIVSVIAVAFFTLRYQRSVENRAVERIVRETREHPPLYPIRPRMEHTGQLTFPESDDALLSELLVALGPGSVRRFVIPRDIVRRVVTTVDGLPTASLGVERRPVTAPIGQPIVSRERGKILLSSKNAHRYTPHVRALQEIHPELVARTYVMFYPLFQQAYEELGHQGKHFNDRLIEVIEHLLETPEVEMPIELIGSRKGYAFRDPSLEQLSTGQKILLRMGPEHASIVKIELRVLLQAILEHSPVEPGTSVQAR